MAWKRLFGKKGPKPPSPGTADNAPPPSETGQERPPARPARQGL